MSNPKIISETPLSMATIKEDLAKIKERDGELSFRANKTDEYLAQFVKISKKEADQLYKDLEALEIPRLKDIHFIKIVDLLPQTEDDVKIIIQSYPVTISAENAKKIAKTVSEFMKDRK